MSSVQIHINMGALAPSLHRQLTEQGYTMPADRLDGFQKDADAITRCYIRGWLTEKATDKARRQLGQNIADTVAKFPRIETNVIELPQETPHDH